ncbi:hypothetical protein ACEPAH_2994 [Sanghuangporus vaninii]
MFFTSFLSALAALTYIHGVSAAPQLTTAIPLGVGTGGNGVISGVIVGSDADGTTFVLTPEATGGAILETVTLVENASGLTANFALANGAATQVHSIGCGISGSSAECTQAIVGVNSASETGSVLSTFSGPVAIATVVVSTSSASAAPSASSSAPTSTESPQASAAGRRAGVNILLSALAVLPILVAMI